MAHGCTQTSTTRLHGGWARLRPRTARQAGTRQRRDGGDEDSRRVAALTATANTTRPNRLSPPLRHTRTPEGRMDSRRHRSRGNGERGEGAMGRARGNVVLCLDDGDDCLPKPKKKCGGLSSRRPPPWAGPAGGQRRHPPLLPPHPHRPRPPPRAWKTSASPYRPSSSARRARRRRRSTSARRLPRSRCVWILKEEAAIWVLTRVSASCILRDGGRWKGERLSASTTRGKTKSSRQRSTKALPTFSILATSLPLTSLSRPAHIRTHVVRPPPCQV